jgi:biopolymer transport protein ExbD
MMPRLRGRRTRHQDPAQLNLTPLIDVLFNLLIFVLASASIAAAGDVPIDLPRSAAAGEPASDPVIVGIGADLSLSVGGVLVTFDGLEDAIAGAIAGEPARPVVLHADRTVPAGVLVEVHDAATRGGAVSIAIATEPVK